MNKKIFSYGHWVSNNFGTTRNKRIHAMKNYFNRNYPIDNDLDNGMKLLNPSSMHLSYKKYKELSKTGFATTNDILNNIKEYYNLSLENKLKVFENIYERDNCLNKLEGRANAHSLQKKGEDKLDTKQVR